MVFVFGKDVVVFVFHVLQSAKRIIGVGEEPHERIRAGAGERIRAGAGMSHFLSIQHLL